MTQKVYAVMYNYESSDYSTLKLFTKLSDAVRFISIQEDYDNLVVKEVNRKTDIPEYKEDSDDCYVLQLKHEEYQWYDLTSYEHISPYVIVTMEVN